MGERRESKKKLNKKLLFAENYVLENYSVAAALRAAGYSVKSQAYAYETLLKDPEVKEHIAWTEAKRIEQTIDMRRAIDADAVAARRDLLRQKTRLEMLIENNFRRDRDGNLVRDAATGEPILESLPWAERELRAINQYLIDKSVPNPPTHMKHDVTEHRKLEEFF